MSLISDELVDLLERVGAAALAGVQDVENDFENLAIAMSEPPEGELCDSINVWLAAINPIQDPAECSLIWDADIRVRLDLCFGFEDPNIPLLSGEERTEITTRFLTLLWAMMAGLTSAWRDGDLPGDGHLQCRKLTWGPVTPIEDEGGFTVAQAQIFVEVSPQYEVLS